MDKEKIQTDIIPGVTIRIFYNDNNINNKTLEIRGVVDEHFVCRQVVHHDGYFYTLKPLAWFKTIAAHITIIN